MITIAIIIFGYFIISLLGYFIHWSFHQKWTGQFHNSHMVHHLELYPPTDYMSDKYRYAGKDNTTKLFIILAIPLVILLISLMFFKIISLKILIILLLELLIIGGLNNYMHDSFHINNHWLGKIPFIKTWFNNLNNLHYRHHIEMEFNYGIFAFHFDKLFKTFKR